MALRNVTTRLGNKLLPLLSSTSTARLLHSHATSFGFKHVKEKEKACMVRDVFTSFAANYDLMNDLMSAGLHRLWKDRLVSMLNPFPGMRHLDVAGGTGYSCRVYFFVSLLFHTWENWLQSIRRFPSQEKFASMIEDAGFQKVEYENLVGGVVAIHSGLIMYL